MTTKRFTSRQAAAYIGCSPTTLKISRSKGTLFGQVAPCYRKMGRTVFYELGILDEWIERFPTIANTSYAANQPEKEGGVR